MKRKKMGKGSASPKVLFTLSIILIISSDPSFLFSQAVLVEARVDDRPDGARVIITANQPLEVTLNKFENTLEVRLKSQEPLRFRSQPVHSYLVRSFGWASTKQGYLLAIDCLSPDFQYETRLELQPFRLEIEFRPLSPKVSPAKDSPIKERVESSPVVAKPLPESTNSIKSIETVEKGEEQFRREPGRRVKTIVIDPGHGGLEIGAKGPGHTLEKDITLAISLKLKEIIERHLALRVILTRDKDIDISLDNRAAVANNNRADLFLSIHANGAFRPKAHGSETYFLSLKATDEEARRLAYLENNSPEFERKIEDESQDQIMMILWDMAQAAFLKQSSQLAEIIQIELNKLLGTANRGVKQAPFKVLTGVACPAVLVEVAFLSNPEEEAKLKDETFQESVALALYRGLLNYLRTTS